MVSCLAVAESLDPACASHSIARAKNNALSKVMMKLFDGLLFGQRCDELDEIASYSLVVREDRYRICYTFSLMRALL